MASQQVLLLAIAVAFLATPASAKDFMVGDDAGWILKYPANWTSGKIFTVGDSLMFMYPTGTHTVVEVTGADFRACNSQNKLGSWTTGSDTVTLDKAGRRWFICGVGDHCSKGMKLIVNVVDVAAAAPAVPGAPPSSSATSVITGAVSQAMAVTGAVAAAVLML